MLLLPATHLCVFAYYCIYLTGQGKWEQLSQSYQGHGVFWRNLGGWQNCLRCPTSKTYEKVITFSHMDDNDADIDD